MGFEKVIYTTDEYFTGEESMDGSLNFMAAINQKYKSLKLL